MIEKIYLIGMGPGDPKYLTLYAVETIKKLKLFLIPAKTGKKSDLTQMRKKIISFVKRKKDYRIIEIPFPERKKGDKYKNLVEEWREIKANILKNILQKETEKEAGFIVWGDPSLYDGYIEIFKNLQKKLNFEIEIIPGISAFQVLSAKHKVSLTQIAGTTIFTTPRQLRKMKNIECNTVVFLDNYKTYKIFANSDLKIYWGAYLGTEKEVLFSGRLKDIIEELIRLRDKLKKEKGWIMETYFLIP